MKKVLVLTFIFFISSLIYSVHNVPTDAFETAGPEAIPQLIEAAESEDPSDIEIKIKAIQRLGELKAKEAVPVLINCLGYGSETILKEGGGKKIYNWKVRVVSAKALAQINDEAAVHPLAKRAFADEDVIVRRAAVQALGLMGEKARTKEVLTFLHDMLEKTKDNALAADICETLGKIGDKSSFVHLLRVTQGNFLNYVKKIAQESIAKTKWDVSSVFEEVK